MPNIYDELHTKYLAYTKTHATAKIVESAVQWYVKEIVRRFGNKQVPFQLASRGASTVAANQIVVGKMYTFEYRADSSEEYYDRYPLVIPFFKNSRQITGFNIHYLPVLYRVLGMTAILKGTSTVVKYPPARDAATTVAYDTIIGTDLNFMKVAIRTYLVRRIRSKIVAVPATGWLSAAFLPTAKYIGNNITPSRVVTQMLNEIRNL
jgi:hypothetical protein